MPLTTGPGGGGSTETPVRGHHTQRPRNGQRLVHRLGVAGWEVMDQVSFNISTLLDQG
ncbi:MAG: hypothetical protein IPO44_05080 [Candidatus Microthrix sp.]|nr:hypothetical protein [Candidatus Microthrix sp.]MBK9558947.1 hypothetical protein [Candidatus Microthrix sp.]